MSFTVKELAQRIGAEVEGDEDCVVHELLPVVQAKQGSICPLFRKKCLDFSAGLPTVVLADRELAFLAIDRGVSAAIVHTHPVMALSALIDLFFPKDPLEGFIHPSSIVDTSALIHETAWVGPGAVIEAGVQIGEGSWIGPNAVICRNSILGRFVRVGPGAVIGYEGFGFVPTDEEPKKLRQVGYVELQDFVEIGANACVDRGTLGKTILGASSKLDNLVQVGHNVRIGSRVLIAAQTGIAGSTRIGDGVLLGGQVGVADHVEIGDGAMVTAQSGVTRDIASEAIVSGTPAISRKIWLRSLASLISGSRDRKGETD